MHLDRYIAFSGLQARLMSVYPDSDLTTRWKKVDLSFIMLIAKLPAAFMACAIVSLSPLWLCSVPCACPNLPLTGQLFIHTAFSCSNLLCQSDTQCWLNGDAFSPLLFFFFF